MTVTPMWEREPVTHDRFDCPACAAGLAFMPPAPSQQPDVRPRWWTPKGALNPAEDPCGRGPMTLVSAEGEGA